MFAKTATAVSPRTRFVYQCDCDTPPFGGGGGHVPSSWILKARWPQKWPYVTSKTWFLEHLGGAHSWAHLTSSGWEDHPAKVPADGKHESKCTLMRVNQWILQPLLEPPWLMLHGAEMSCPCWARLDCMSETTVVVSHWVLDCVDFLQGNNNKKGFPNKRSPGQLRNVSSHSRETGQQVPDTGSFRWHG